MQCGQNGSEKLTGGLCSQSGEPCTDEDAPKPGLQNRLGNQRIFDEQPCSTNVRLVEGEKSQMMTVNLTGV